MELATSRRCMRSMASVEKKSVTPFRHSGSISGPHILYPSSFTCSSVRALVSLALIKSRSALASLSFPACSISEWYVT